MVNVLEYKRLWCVELSW